jgi:hypothetical protein
LFSRADNITHLATNRNFQQTKSLKKNKTENWQNKGGRVSFHSLCKTWSSVRKTDESLFLENQQFLLPNYKIKICIPTSRVTLGQWRHFSLCFKTRCARLGCVAQVAECLPSKCEALSSNSNTTTKMKRLAFKIIFGMVNDYFHKYFDTFTYKIIAKNSILKICTLFKIIWRKAPWISLLLEKSSTSKNLFSFYLFAYFLGGIGVWTQGLALIQASQNYTSIPRICFL